MDIYTWVDTYTKYNIDYCYAVMFTLHHVRAVQAAALNVPLGGVITLLLFSAPRLNLDWHLLYLDIIFFIKRHHGLF